MTRPPQTSRHEEEHDRTLCTIRQYHEVKASTLSQ
ncbi:unnamed protein product [Ectocarpus sp. 12 AP-2014]